MAPVNVLPWLLAKFTLGALVSYRQRVVVKHSRGAHYDRAQFNRQISITSVALPV